MPHITCSSSHGACAAARLPGGMAVVGQPAHAAQGTSRG